MQQQSKHQVGSAVRVAKVSFVPTVSQDLPKELVESHYPSTQQLPDYFTNTAYVRFTPEVDCLALPGGRQQCRRRCTGAMQCMALCTGAKAVESFRWAFGVMECGSLMRLSDTVLSKEQH